MRASILDNGWSEKAGAYTQYYGSDDLDASTLLMAILGFLPPDDLRLLASIDAIEDGLSDDRGLLFRCRGGDGFDGPEGTFLLCTFWLAHALAVTGQVQRARDTLLRAAGYATELGLFAEQVDTATGELLGTSRRHSAISGWSTPRKRSPRPNAITRRRYPPAPDTDGTLGLPSRLPDTR